MSKDQRDILDVLRVELEFLEQGGYGRSVSTPWKWSSTFQHSPSCINYNRAPGTRPCTECTLMDLVPADAQNQDVPCHSIPIGPNGETVGTMEREHDLLELEEELRNWLRTTIQKLEQQRARETTQLLSA
jgi:hypothetical protein